MAVENQSHFRLAIGPDPRYRALVEHATEGVAVVQDARFFFFRQPQHRNAERTSAAGVHRPGSLADVFHPDDLPRAASLGLVTDVTEQQRAAEALSRSEAQHRQVVESANEGISVIQERRFVLANRRMGVITGYPPEFLPAMPSAVSLIRPDDPALYTLAFGRDGSVRVKADCNMGTGSWLSESASQLQFGVLASTQAECGPNSLHDRYKSQFQWVRSYVLKDGHLFLATMADGSIIEFEPAPVAP